MEINEKPQYIGDGVYIRSDGYHVILEANPHKIYMDASVRRILYEILAEEFGEQDEDR